MLRFLPMGRDTECVVVSIIDDDIFEVQETFSFIIPTSQNDQAVNVVGANTATVSITDPEDGGKFKLM